jgi:hypothetical protein
MGVELMPDWKGMCAGENRLLSSDSKPLEWIFPGMEGEISSEPFSMSVKDIAAHVLPGSNVYFLGSIEVFLKGGIV